MPIDRRAILSTYSPVVERWDPASFISVGNGEFATTVDYTGMQTILPTDPAATPLATMASWGFHSYPDPMVGRYDLLQRKTYQGSKGPIGYMSDAAGQEALYETLRINPHRFNLARFSLFAPNRDESNLKEQITEAQQRLDLFSGTITSVYRLAEVPVTVVTAVHPEQDQLSISLTSEADLGMLLSFPYPSHQKDGSNWEAEALHTTTLRAVGSNRWKIARTVDDTLYTVEILTNAHTQLSLGGAHQILVKNTSKTLEINMLFSPDTADKIHPVDFTQCIQASGAHWQRFWLEGGFVDVTQSQDGRAGELQRRILLSQYLLAIQSCGSTPPAETGLTCNSWYGKFHLEMHLLHAAHFPLWGHPELLERSLPWYRQILQKAYERALEQGYSGARWPKMSEPGGSDAPSWIGTLLCWQQPHPIFYAALLEEYASDSQELAAWDEILAATATFMVDYVSWDEQSGTYQIGPPVIPVQENHAPTEVLNPTFELSYWRWALDQGITMRQKRKLPIDPKWIQVQENLAPLPTGEGRYLAHKNCPNTYGAFAEDHPSLLFALTLFGGEDVNLATMENSLDAVLEHWDLNELWGWDFPLMAMCAARLGKTDLALDLLLMDSPKNTYTPNGHNAQLPKEDLPLYLPGNGALLLAVALMAAGWKGSTGEAPGFPEKGWSVKAEGVFPLF